MGYSAPSITKFIELKDTPTSYSGQGAKVLEVKVTEDGVEFIDSRDVLNRMKPFLIFELDTGFAETLTGSGYRWAGKFETTVLTGTTSGSTSGYVTYFPIWHQYNVAGLRYQFSCRLEMGDTTDMLEGWVGFLETTNVFPTLTSNHYGFRIISTSDGVNAKLQATNGKGTAGTQSDIVPSLSPGQRIYLFAVYGENEIKFYYSYDAKTWYLGATHTTNRPTETNLYFGFWIKNYEAVDKRIKIHTPRLSEAD